MRSRPRFIIALAAAVITFATLSVFAKPFYSYNRTYSSCWYDHKENHEQSDSLKTNY
jgi:hypothetical protein